MRRTSWLTPLLLLVALAGTATSVCGRAAEPQGTLKKIIDSGVIRLGFQRDAPPFSVAGADGKPRGYSIELCNRVVTGIRNEYSLPLDIEWVEVTSVNRFQQVADGSVDLECGASGITLSRLKLVDFSAMTWIDSKTFLVKRGQTVKSLADLAGKKVAVAQGTTTERVLREALLGQVLGGGPVTTQLVIVKDRYEGLDALLKGTVDALAADRTLLAALARGAPNPDQLAFAEYHLAYEPYGLMMRRNDADFRYAVNQVLAGLYRSGAVKEIYSRWFADLGPLPPLLDSLYDLNGLRE
jgi:glutamate/aspartate transport system substrate-binding protein